MSTEFLKIITQIISSHSQHTYYQTYYIVEVIHYLPLKNYGEVIEQKVQILCTIVYKVFSHFRPAFVVKNIKGLDSLCCAHQGMLPYCKKSYILVNAQCA